MNEQLEDVASITLEADSRSARWKKLKSYLRELKRKEDSVNAKLALLVEQAEQIQRDSLKLTEALQTLSDCANEEAQREISLTLNDMDFDIVVDAQSQPTLTHTAEADNEGVESYDLVNELKELPGIGDATAKKIAKHIQETGRSKSQQLASLLADIRQGGTSQQTLFQKEGD